MTIQELIDRFIGFQVDLSRLFNGSVFDVLKELNKHDPDLLARLTDILDDLEGRYSEARLNAAIKQFIEVNSEAFAAAKESLNRQVENTALATSKWLEVTYALGADVVAANSGQVMAGIRSRPFQGILLKEALKGIEANRAEAVRRIIRIGFAEGKTTQEIVRAIKGTKATNYADGLLNRSRKDIQTMVRTALSHASRASMDQFYSENSDIIGSLMWLSTLDNRTSSLCVVRSGLKYTNEEMPKPIGHKVPWLSGPGRLHFNCRSVSLALLNEQEKLFGTRSSMDGYVGANTTYGDWLKRQPESVVSDVLGPTRANLFKAGKIPLDKFFTDTGQLMTLNQFYTKHGIKPD